MPMAANCFEVKLPDKHFFFNLDLTGSKSFRSDGILKQKMTKTKLPISSFESTRSEWVQKHSNQRHC